MSINIITIKFNNIFRSKLWGASLIVGVASLFYLYEFFLRVAPSAMVHELMRDFAIDASTLGLMSSGFYYAYAIMQIPAGILCDRYGPKKLLTLAVFICSIATIVFANTHNVYTASLSRTAIGMAAAVAFIGPLTLTARWFPLKYFAFVTGVIQTLGCIGAMVGSEPIAFMVSFYGWRFTLIYCAIAGLCLTFAFIVLIKDAPDKTQLQIRLNSFSLEIRRLCKILKHKQTWWNALMGTNCWTPIAIFELWGIPYLQQWGHCSTAQAGNAMVMMWLGIAIASPIAGYYSNKIKLRF